MSGPEKFALGMWFVTAIAMWVAAKYKDESAGCLTFLLVIVSLAATCGSCGGVVVDMSP